MFEVFKKKTEKNTFSKIFDTHYEKLFNYSIKVLKEKDAADELVQETFIRLWEKIENIDEGHEIEPFLFAILKNKIIDYYRRNSTRKKYEQLYSNKKEFQQSLNNEWEILELLETIYSSLGTKTLEIFRLSRDRGLTYKEIASQKNVSIKTVELHISKALTILRKQLRSYL